MKRIRHLDRPHYHAGSLTGAELCDLSRIAVMAFKHHNCDQLAEWLTLMISDEIKRRRDSRDDIPREPSLYEAPVFDPRQTGRAILVLQMAIARKQTPRVYDFLDWLAMNTAHHAVAYLSLRYENAPIPSEMKLCRA